MTDQPQPKPEPTKPVVIDFSLGGLPFMARLLASLDADGKPIRPVWDCAHAQVAKLLNRQHRPATPDPAAVAKCVETARGYLATMGPPVDAAPAKGA